MIANELNRAKYMFRKKDVHEMKQALERAFELIDLTVEHARQNLRYELLRFREVLAMFYVNETHDITYLQTLSRMVQLFNAKLVLSLTRNGQND